MRFRRVRKRSDESGFTLPEMVVTIAIMGIVIAPLSMALIQALTLVPQSGARTQTATDAIRLNNSFVGDVTQAQGIDMWFGGSWATHTWTAPTGQPTSEFAEANPTTWTQVTIPYGGSAPSQSYTCPGTSLAGTQSIDLFDAWWSDTPSFGNVAAASGRTMAKYQLRFTTAPNTTTLQQVQVWRQTSVDGAAAIDDATPLLTGWCNGGDSIATVTALPTSDLGHAQETLSLTLFLRTQVGGLVANTTVQAAARPSGVSD